MKMGESVKKAQEAREAEDKVRRELTKIMDEPGRRESARKVQEALERTAMGIGQDLKEQAQGRPLAAVCLVIRRNGKVLLHKRKGRHAPGTWAFPGGHLEMF